MGCSHSEPSRYIRDITLKIDGDDLRHTTIFFRPLPFQDPPTCADAVFQCVSAVDQQLLQVLWLFTQLQAEALQAILQLVRVVEVQHLHVQAGVKGGLSWVPTCSIGILYITF